MLQQYSPTSRCCHVLKQWLCTAAATIDHLQSGLPQAIMAATPHPLHSVDGTVGLSLSAWCTALRAAHNASQ